MSHSFRRLFVFLLVAILLIGHSIPVLAKGGNGQPPAWVADWAKVIPDDEERALAGMLESYAKRTGHQIIVGTLDNLQGRPIEAWGKSIGNSWGIGRAGYDDGVVILVAPRERAMRIEVGEGLTKTLTTEVTDDIVERQMKPAFRSGQYGVGMNAAAFETMKIIDQGGVNLTSGFAGYYQDLTRRLTPQAILLILGDVVIAALLLIARRATHYRRHCPYCALGGHCDYHPYGYGHDHHRHSGSEPSSHPSASSGGTFSGNGSTGKF